MRQEVEIPLVPGGKFPISGRAINYPRTCNSGACPFPGKVLTITELFQQVVDDGVFGHDFCPKNGKILDVEKDS